MAGTIGGEIDQLEHLHSELSTQSGNVHDLLTSLSSTLDATWWQGGAADRFRNEWESDFKPALQRLAEALSDAGEEVRSRTQALIEVGS